MKYLFILISLLFSCLLSGCAGLQNYMTQISNKHDSSQAASAASAANQLPAPKCDHWCHNGWCSEHCEGDANQNQW